MRERDLPYLVVLDHNRHIVGMVTMRDLDGGKKQSPFAEDPPEREDSFQRIGDSWRKKKSPFVATQVTSRNAPAVTASMISDPKL